MGCIYKITNKINAKSYIGMTKWSADGRWKTHCLASKVEKPSGLLHKAIKKYGAQFFSVEVLFADIEDWEELGQIEYESIIAQKTLAPNGYNLNQGGYGAPGHLWTAEQKRLASERMKRLLAERPELRQQRSDLLRAKWQTREWQEKIARITSKPRGPWSDERRKSRSALMIGNQHLLGHRHTEETKRLISVKNSGRTLSGQARQNIASAKIGDKNPMFGKPSPRRGVKLSEETKRLISEKAKARIAKAAICA